MYKNNFLALKDPFRFCPDEHTAFRYHNYLSGLEYLQNIIDFSKKNVVLVTGVTGVGKSTLINDCLRRQDDSRVLSSVLQASHINSGGFMSAISHVIDEDVEEGDSELIPQLGQYLARIKNQKICIILVIEDAHDLCEKAMNTLGRIVRLISDNAYNMKVFLTSKHSVNTLREHVRNDALFKKNIAGWNLRGLGINDISTYVEHRFENAGGENTLEIDKKGWQTIYRFSEGVPRRVNRICNRLLFKGQFENKEVFVNVDVIDVINQLDTEGLLEVSRLLASSYGLVGSSEDNVDKSCEPDLRSFFAGFSAPILIENKAEHMESIEVTNHAEKKEDEVFQDVHEAVSPSSDILKANIIPIRPDLNDVEIIESKAGAGQQRNILFLSFIFMIAFFILVLYPVILPNKTKVYLFSPENADNNKSLSKEPASSEPVLTQRSNMPEKKALVLIDKIQALTNTRSEDGDKIIKATMQDDIVVTKGNAEVVTQPSGIKVPFVSKKISARSYTEKQLIEMLLGGFWSRNGRPAVLLPSELNKCSESERDIYCLAKGINKHSGSDPGRYNTGAMLTDFSSSGRFTVIYRSAPLKKTDNITALQEETVELEMQCKFTSKHRINCTRDGVRLRYLRHNRVKN